MMSLGEFRRRFLKLYTAQEVKIMVAQSYQNGESATYQKMIANSTQILDKLVSSTDVKDKGEKKIGTG
jgi:hypothetical protein